MAQRDTLSALARCAHSTLREPAVFTGSLASSLTGRPYLDYGYLASAACRG